MSSRGTSDVDPGAGQQRVSWYVERWCRPPAVAVLVQLPLWILVPHSGLHSRSLVCPTLGSMSDPLTFGERVVLTVAARLSLVSEALGPRSRCREATPPLSLIAVAIPGVVVTSLPWGALPTEVLVSGCTSTLPGARCPWMGSWAWNAVPSPALYPGENDAGMSWGAMGNMPRSGLPRCGNGSRMGEKGDPRACPLGKMLAP